METRSARRRRDTLCPICLERGVNVRPVRCVACWFHVSCLSRWCEEENSCPTCRSFFNYMIVYPGYARVYVADRVSFDDSESDVAELCEDSDARESSRDG